MITLPEDPAKAGSDLLHNPQLNKGTAFTEKEREALGLRGLLPPHVSTIEEQEERVLARMRKEPTDLQKHMYLIDLQERNRTLFYHIVMKNLDEIMPLIYTPTVGKACQEYGHIFRRPQGLFISLSDKGRIAEVLANWPEDNVEVIVVTDGERILGLGDLGASGMGIPVGKLSLYTACAGIDPQYTLPITLDMGTNNQDFQKDPLYLGLRHPRVQGQEFDEFMEEFVNAVKERFPRALLQFEDFGNHNAFRLLETYRNQLPSFNDDIQGTAAVTLAGIYGSLRITGKPLSEQKFVFLGAGEAGIGIGELFVSAMVEDGLSEEEARLRCWFVDSRGLVVKSRTDLRPHKLAFAHDAEFQPDLLSAVKELKPTAIIGVSGQPRMFTQPIVEAMAEMNDRPIVFSLSNPTSKSECTAEEAYVWSGGTAIFASGSPFDPVKYNGHTFVPGQGNNSYVFPGIGLGVVVSQATQVTDEMFLAAARTLAQLTDEEDLGLGRVYPPLSDIRDISAQIAKAVVKIAVRDGLARADLPEDPIDVIRAKMYQPVYEEYV
jgi:malate dehydrogenase (oxaloacetate-decarboxylating)(NADP+)